MRKSTQRLMWYIVVSIPMFIILAFISGAISEAYPNNLYLFGIPFDIGSFIFWTVWLGITIVLILYFPKTKKRGEL